VRDYASHWRKKQAELAKPRPARSPEQAALDLLDHGDPVKAIADAEHMRMWGTPPPAPAPVPSEHERAVADWKRRHAQRLAKMLGPPRRR
jgi:hypothetical protein